MPRSFHVVRERTAREVVLCHAENENAARDLADNGGGEIIDSNETVSVRNVEETVHSKRRRTEEKVQSLAPSYDEGAMGDALVGQEEPATVTAPVYHAPIQESAARSDVGWRDMVPGDIPEAGDEYRLRPSYPWEPVTRTLIGQAITKQTRAQFRARRYR